MRMFTVSAFVLLASLSTSPEAPSTQLLPAAVEEGRVYEALGATTAILDSSSALVTDVIVGDDVTTVLFNGERLRPFDADQEDAFIEALAGAHTGFALSRPILLDVVNADGSRRPLGGREQVVHDRRAATRPKAPHHAPPKTRSSDRFPFGSALLGYRIAISAGHGWLVDGSGWRTQRDRWTGCAGCRGIVEDFFTQEVVSRQVLPLLQQMGAEIVVVREPNLEATVAQVIVDDSNPGYGESGEWSPGTDPIGWAGSYRTNADTDLGAASFLLPMQSDKPVRVSLRYPEGQNRTTAAIVSVNHAAGTRTFNLDQTKMGRHWLDLGAFVMGPNGSVDIAHGPAAGFLIADAVKAGGGIWAASGHPAWQMSAKEYVPWSGAPSSVTSRADVTIRPAFAETTNPDLYISIHANAAGVTGGSSANGISTYRYSCGSYPNFTSSANASACDDPPGSTALIDTVHQAMVDSLRSEWDPNFGNRGTLVANFGEVRELDDTPGILIETAFFDNNVDPAGSPPPAVNDNTALHDPRWREAFARGLAEGIAQHLTGGHAPPDRPTGLMARNERDGTLTLTWEPVAGALGYRVYTAREGRAFDEGIVIDGDNRHVVTDAPPREVLVFKVAALDENGEGFASAAVGARFRGALLSSTVAPAHALLVTAYDRWDARVQDEDNDLTYAVEIAHAFGSTERDYFFDGALDEVVDDNPSALAPYDGVIWNAGKDSTFHKPFSATARDAIAGLHARGGVVIASGEEIGWALVETSTDSDDEAFLADVFGATFEADDAATYSATGTGPFSALGTFDFDDGEGGVYEVKFPDVFAPIAPANVGLTYPDGTAAAIVTEQSVLMGFPLETVLPAAARGALARAALAHLAPDIGSNDLDADGANDACETNAGFDFRDDADGPAARQACDGDAGPGPEPEPEPEPVDGGEPDGGSTSAPEGEPSAEPEGEPSVAPEGEPASGQPEGEPDAIDRFNIAPEPAACACMQATAAAPNVGLSALLLCVAVACRRRRHPTTEGRVH